MQVVGSFYRATASTALQQGRNKKNSVSIAGVRPPKHRLLSLTYYFDNHNNLSSHIQKAKISGYQGSTDRREKINSFKNMRISSLSFNCSRCLSGKLVMTLASRGNNASDAKPRKSSPGAGWFFRSGLHTVNNDVFKDSVRRYKLSR